MNGWALQGRGSKEAMSKTVTSKESEMFSKRAATSAKSCYLSQRIFHIVKKHKEVSDYKGDSSYHNVAAFDLGIFCHLLTNTKQ